MTIQSGFSQPVLDSQACFRQVLAALSEPGSVNTLGLHIGFEPLAASVCQIVLSLCDNHTQLFVDPSSLMESQSTLDNVIENIKFHTDTKISDKSRADFVITSASSPFVAEDYKSGTEMYPEDSATILLETNSFEGGTLLQLSGPGIEHTRQVRLGHIHSSLLDALIQPAYKYPLGQDFIFCCGEQIVAISRTTKVEISACM
ncbi:phosphonate C-P lyase system protein PhnH [Alginatibacterium sediminis]|uniref:Phosphonate C-P lyase system protein PhnH n=1 Tax=Alginatibacterium sediminis TaxID=2164068 RepID=A0A420EL35_9ALTE|nr:phosphonate C-P lyase system protein PhnH [Alginatibacterium sediminis]RKF21432.1 phosphonate C-P lyase system protein PhnH [Alginatibacterium sediminis]